MATWKKVVVSGSAISQLNNDSNYLVDGQSGASLTGSFTGSFTGDGSGLTNVPISGTASNAVSASHAVNADNAISASYALTASYVNTLNQDVTITGSLDLALLSGSTSNLAIEGNIFNQTQLSTNGALVLNPGPGGVAMAGTNQTIEAPIFKGTAAGSYLTGSFTGSFTGDGSGLTGVVSSSYALSASHSNTADSATSAVSASEATHALSSSYANFATNSDIANSATSASHAVNADAAISASFATYAASAGTASYATNAGAALTATSASHAVSADTSISASYATFAADAANAVSASLAQSAISASRAVSAASADTATSASYATTASYALNANADLAFSGSTGAGTVDLASQVLSIVGTANEIETTAGSQTLTIGLPSDVTIGNNLIVNNNLTVLGTASFQSTTNLEVADRFILLASGSNTPGEGGIVIQQGTQNVGEAFAWHTTELRWGITGSFDSGNSSFVPEAYMSAVIEGAASDPTTTVAKLTKKGNIFVAADETIWIYS